jgi:hypothetical protein
LNSHFSDVYYYYALNLDAWSRSNGLVELMARRTEILFNLREAFNKESRAGTRPGAIDGCGPNRLFGRIYLDLPVEAGGSSIRAIENFRRAVKESPVDSRNPLSLAESLLYSKSPDERAEANALLGEMLKHPATDSYWEIGRKFDIGEDLVRASELIRSVNFR